MTHTLKTFDEFMMDIATGKKPFEVRFNDRGFLKGHTLLLEGWDNKVKEYTGNVIEAEVTYILYGGQFGIDKGFCVMGIKVKNYNL